MRSGEEETRDYSSLFLAGGLGVQVLPGVHLVRDEFVNTYLVETQGSLVLIDAGINGDPVLRYLERTGISPSSVELVIITHHHYDHVDGLQRIREATGARVAAHRDEAPLIERATGIRPDILLEHNSTVKGLLVIHTPGHTPGHIALLDPGREALFTGDLVYEKNGELHEIPRHYSMDPDRNRESIRSLLGYSFKHLLPSHGDPVLGNAKKKLQELVEKLST